MLYKGSMKQASDHKFIIAQELQVNFYLKKTMKGGLAVIVLVGAFIIAAEGACTFNRWDFLDGIGFFYNSDGNNSVHT